MARCLCERLSLASINHYGREGTWIRDAKCLWKTVMIMRSIPDKLPILDKSCFLHLSRYWLLCSGPWWRSLHSWVTLHTSDPVGSVHVCQRHMSVCVATLPATNWGQTGCWSCIMAGNYFPKTRPVHGNDTRAQYLVQWKVIVAVSIVFLERGWQGSGDGTGPCCTKRIMKTKQLWQVWNLRTLPERYEDYQSQAVRWRGGSLLFCAQLWMWLTGKKIRTLSFTFV